MKEFSPVSHTKASCPLTWVKIFSLEDEYMNTKEGACIIVKRGTSPQGSSLNLEFDFFFFNTDYIYKRRKNDHFGKIQSFG